MPTDPTLIYPFVPPTVQLKTTGGYTGQMVQFHPHFNSEGTILLNILNTGTTGKIS